MARGDFAQAQLNGDRFVESSLEHPDQVSAPPLAPTESAADSDILLQLEALARISRDGHSFQPPEQNDLLETETSFESRRKLIAGTAIVVALGAGALAYFLLPSGGENTATQTAESAPTVQPSPMAPVQAAPPVCLSHLLRHLVVRLLRCPIFHLPSLSTLLPSLPLRLL